MSPSNETGVHCVRLKTYGLDGDGRTDGRGWTPLIFCGSHVLCVIALGIGWYVVDCTDTSRGLLKNEEIVRPDPLRRGTLFDQDGSS